MSLDKESISSILNEIISPPNTINTNNKSQNSIVMNRQKNIYNSLPPKRLFTKKGQRTNKTLGILVLIFCGFVFLAVSFTLPSFIVPPTSDVTTITNISDPISNENENRNGDSNNNSSGNINNYVDSNGKTNAKVQTKTRIIQNMDLKSCSFRTYKSNRYYKVDDENKEDFLSNADYIRGELPFILNPRSISGSSSSSSSLLSTTQPKKLCLDTSEWEDVKDGYYPFSDGQNPSIISLSSNVYNLTGAGDHHRLDSNYIQPLIELYADDHDVMDDLYLGLLLFGDSQCRWNLSESELEDRKFSPLQKAPNKRSMVVLFDSEMQVIDSTVLKLVLDANWGGKRKNIKMKKIKEGVDGDEDVFESKIVELDDSRLFFHNGKLNVLYRNGPFYGYDSKSKTFMIFLFYCLSSSPI